MAVTAHLHRVALYIDGQIGGFLEVTIHMEYMIGRGEHHVPCALGVSENHRLEYVDYLCYVGHTYAVAMSMKDME